MLYFVKKYLKNTLFLLEIQGLDLTRSEFDEFSTPFHLKNFLNFHSKYLFKTSSLNIIIIYTQHII